MKIYSNVDEQRKITAVKHGNTGSMEWLGSVVILKGVGPTSGSIQGFEEFCELCEELRNNYDL